MNFIYGLLSVLIVLDSLFLILLVLIQLPKKEAGLGQAFGGATTDALFGSGSGNALTNLTKYATGLFFAMAVVMLVMNTHRVKSGTGRLREELKNVQPRNVVVPTPPADPSRSVPLLTTLPTNVVQTNKLLSGTNNPVINTITPAPAPQTTPPPLINK